MRVLVPESDSPEEAHKELPRQDPAEQDEAGEGVEGQVLLGLQQEVHLPLVRLRQPAEGQTGQTHGEARSPGRSPPLRKAEAQAGGPAAEAPAQRGGIPLPVLPLLLHRVPRAEEAQPRARAGERDLHAQAELQDLREGPRDGERDVAPHEEAPQGGAFPVRSLRVLQRSTEEDHPAQTNAYRGETPPVSALQLQVGAKRQSQIACATHA